jgi:hypothetical protein
MPRLFVQHVAAIAASLAFAFFRPASALDINVPHISVPRVSVPVPHVSVPRVSVPHVNVPHVSAPHLKGFAPGSIVIRRATGTIVARPVSQTPNNLSSADTYSVGVGCGEPAGTCR